MSNEKRIATVTAAVTTLVQTAVETLGLTPAPMVAPRNLENAGDHALVAVHLHRISTNDSLRNIGPGVHRGGAEVSKNPRVALDLHYLVAFRADSELDAQRMLAVSAAAIGSNAVLSDELLTRSEAAYVELNGHNLRDVSEPVELRLQELSVDELSRIWSLYAVGSFALTLGVMVGPVLL